MENNTPFINLSLSEFLEKLSSKEPAPGGGGVAALTAAQGAALASMVCNLTIGKKSFEIYRTELESIRKTAISLQERCLELIDEDRENFLPLAQAYGIKAQTEEEKLAKEKLMEEALLTACKAPFETLEKAIQILKLHEILLEKGTKLAISDVGVGAEMIRAAIVSASMNIYINTGMLKDRKVKQEMEEKVQKMTDDGVLFSNQISQKVLDILKKP